jgi:hypothetical protein
VFGSPFGFTVPFSVAPDDVTLVAGVVVTLGVAAVVNEITVPYVVPCALLANACA